MVRSEQIKFKLTKTNNPSKAILPLSYEVVKYGYWRAILDVQLC